MSADEFDDGTVRLLHDDCMRPDHDAEDYLLGTLGPVDAIVTDPPYGDTSLEWDRAAPPAWIEVAAQITDTLWCFGSMRFHMAHAAHFAAGGWKYGQEVVWEKHNGSGFHADRFKRVHELAVHYYRGAWADQHREVPTTADATARTVRRKARPAHTGHIEKSSYVSHDGGPRLMRSVIRVRSEHGRAVHPTQKPLGILRPLIEYSVPPGGIVLDPFAGSGSTLRAARSIGRRAIGIELQADYCAAAVGLLNQMEMVA